MTSCVVVFYLLKRRLGGGGVHRHSRGKGNPGWNASFRNWPLEATTKMEASSGPKAQMHGTSGPLNHAKDHSLLKYVLTEERNPKLRRGTKEHDRGS